MANLDIHDMLLDDDEQMWQDLAKLSDDGTLLNAQLTTHYDQPLRAASLCWGGLLQGDVERHPAVNKGAHFKDKLCESCRVHGILVPVERLRALTPELHDAHVNRHSGGFWTTANDGSHCEYRVINQTAKCVPPRLVAFRSAPAVPSCVWAPIPPEWVQDGCVRLVSRLGTLVPDAAVLERLPDRRLLPASTTSLTSVVGGAATAEARPGPQPDARADSGALSELLAAHTHLESLISRHLALPSDQNDAAPQHVAAEEHSRLQALLEPLRASTSALRAGVMSRREAGGEVVKAAPMTLSSWCSSHSYPITLPPSPPLSSIAEGPADGTDVGQLAHKLGGLLTVDYCAPEHTVGVGETLATIAMRHGLQKSQLRAWNGLLSDRAVVGQQLRLEAPDAAALGITFSAPHERRRGSSEHKLVHQAPMPHAEQIRIQPMWPLNAARTPFRPFAAEPEEPGRARVR